MVLYFSATGNTQFLATELAKKLGDECIDLLERIKKNDLSEVRSEKPFIICTPVYVCEMPRFLSKYLKKLEYMGHAEIVMPRNYFIGHYPVQTNEEIKERLLNACDKLDAVANAVKSGNRLRGRYVFMFEKLITIPFNPVWTKYKMPASDFFVTEKCISCGRCEKLCPLNNISIKEKMPVWGKNCTHCMSCIGNCPADAIEYGNITKEKGKYNFKKYRHFLNGEKPVEAEKQFSVNKNLPKRRKNG